MSLSESCASQSRAQEPLSDSVVNQFESLAMSEADGAPPSYDDVFPPPIPSSFTIATPGHNLIVTPSVLVPAVVSQGAAAAQALAALAATTGASMGITVEPNVSPSDAALVSHAFLAFKGWLVSPTVAALSADTLAQAGGLIAAWAERPSTRRALWRGSAAALAGYCAGTAVGHVGRAASVWAGSVLITTALLAKMGYIEGFHAQKLVSDATHMALWGVGSLINLAAGSRAEALAHVSSSTKSDSPHVAAPVPGAAPSPDAARSLAAPPVAVASAAVSVVEEGSDAEQRAGSDAESDGISSLECSLVGGSLSGSYESVIPPPLGGSQAPSLSESRQNSVSDPITSEIVTAACRTPAPASPSQPENGSRMRVNYGAIIRSVSIVFVRDPPVAVGFSSGFFAGLLMG